MFSNRNGELWAEGVPLSSIAEEFGTPCYVYSRAALEAGYRAFDGAFDGLRHQVCYAVKANSNLAVLNLLARLGSGFDIVSGGELARVLAAGGDAGKTVFSGVGKTAVEMQQALASGVFCFNVESYSELAQLNQVAAEMQMVAPVSFRLNPDVDARTHPYISTGLKQNKFGIDAREALAIYRLASELPAVAVHGIDCHIGSQITDLAACVEAMTRMFAVVDRLEEVGISIRHVNLGGGLGIPYRSEPVIAVRDYAAAVRTAVGARRHQLIFEPGRLLVGNAGVLLTRVGVLKHGSSRNFAVVDAAMNDLIRPALYDAWHEVKRVVGATSAASARYDVVGPICESADFLARDRDLCLVEGDLLAVMSAGAYAMTMSSNYNSRPRAAEIMVDGDKAHIVRQRELVQQLFAHECILP